MFVPTAPLFCALLTPFACPLGASLSGKKPSLLCRVLEHPSGGLLLSPAPKPSAKVGGVKLQDMTDAYKAAHPCRVVVQDPVFRFAKQAIPALARSGSVPHVFLNPIFHDGPQQMAGWLGADTLGGLSGKNSPGRIHGECAHSCLFTHNSFFLASLVKRFRRHWRMWRCCYAAVT